MSAIPLLVAKFHAPHPTLLHCHIMFCHESMSHAKHSFHIAPVRFVLRHSAASLLSSENCLIAPGQDKIQTLDRFAFNDAHILKDLYHNALIRVLQYNQLTVIVHGDTIMALGQLDHFSPNQPRGDEDDQ